MSTLDQLESIFSAAGKPFLNIATGSSPDPTNIAAYQLGLLKGRDPNADALRNYEARTITLPMAQAEMQGREAYGNSFLNAVGGASGSSPQGPMQGGPSSAAGGASPSGSLLSPQVQGASAGQASPTAPSPQGGLSWQSIATALQQKAPGLSGLAMASAIDKFQPLMSAQSKSQWNMQKAQMQMDMREQQLNIQQQRLQDQNNYQRDMLGIRQELADKARDWKNQPPSSGQGQKDYDQDKVDALAKQYLAIGPQALSGAPRGLKSAVLMSDAVQDANVEDLQNNWLKYKSNQSAATLAGRRAAGTGLAGAEFASLGDSAIKAAQDLGVSGFKPIGNLQTFLATQFNDPKMQAFQAQVYGLQEQLARAQSGGTAPQIQQLKAAQQQLETAQSPRAFAAAVRALQNVIKTEAGAQEQFIGGLGRTQKGGGSSDGWGEVKVQ